MAQLAITPGTMIFCRSCQIEQPFALEPCTDLYHTHELLVGPCGHRMTLTHAKMTLSTTDSGDRRDDVLMAPRRGA